MKKTSAKNQHRAFHDAEWQEVFGTLVESPYEEVPDDLFDDDSSAMKEVVR